MKIRILMALSLLVWAASCRKDNSPEPSLSVTPTTISVLTAGGTQELQITANVDWTLSKVVTAEWLTLNKTAGSSTDKVTLTIAANPSTATRKAELKLEAGGTSPVIITVEQSALQVSKLQGQRGTDITVTGHPFSAATQLKIGEVAATDITRSGNTLTFKIPATATGGTLSVVDGSFSWNSPEAFEVTNIWVKVADLDIAQRYGATSFVIGDKLYFGLGEVHTNYKNDFYEVDLKTWAVNPMPNYPGGNVEYATSATFNGKGYIIGGLSETGDTRTVYAFNPATTGKWEGPQAALVVV